MSGVATHPNIQGRGYAGLLTRFLVARILARAEVPFLHA
ncbi:MAG: GNAT family N-acetyltransferase [Vulcanimicrobiota bacterium]